MRYPNHDSFPFFMDESSCFLILLLPSTLHFDLIRTATQTEIKRPRVVAVMDVPVARYRRSRWMDGGTNRGKDPFSSGKVATVRAAAAGAPNENSPHVASLGRRANVDRIRSLSQNEMTKFSPPVRNLDLQAVCLFKDFHQSNGRSERRRKEGRAAANTQ